MDIDQEKVVLALKVVSTVSTGLFAGGAMYINVTESPARMTFEMPMACTMWKPSFLRAKSSQSKYLILSALSSFGVHALTSSKDDCKSWLIAGGAMASLFPFTLLFIKPVNDVLLETNNCIEKGDEFVKERLCTWNKLHAVRTATATGAFALLVYTLAKN